jgi:hypothetical protein
MLTRLFLTLRRVLALLTSGSATTDDSHGGFHVRHFLWVCAGADVAILSRDECSTDHARYDCFGAMVCLTALLATGACYFAVTDTFDSPGAALVVALVWGATIFVLDRSMLIGLRKQIGAPRRHIWAAAPRLALAVTVSCVISAPIELRIFAPEISAQMEASALDAARLDGGRFDAGTQSIANCQKENELLQTQIGDANQAASRAYDQMIAEREGSAGTGIEGRGLVYGDKERRYNHLLAVARNVETRNQAKINENRIRLTNLHQDRDRVLMQIGAARRAGRGILARIAALHEIEADPKNGAVLRTTVFFVFLLFVFIELSAVLAKLTSPEGVYEAAVSAHITAGRKTLRTPSSEVVAEHEAAILQEVLAFERQTVLDHLAVARKRAVADSGGGMIEEFNTGVRDRFRRVLSYASSRQ